MRTVSSEELSLHKPRCERLAHSLGRRPGVEVDDLVQEGWMFVFTGLREGHQRTDDQILSRMRRYIRKEQNQREGWVPLRDEDGADDEDG